MARQKKQVKPLPTIWEASDELWNIIQPILDELDRPADTGRPRTDPRRRSTASFTRCEAVANGTTCLRSSATTAASIARCNDGFARAFSSGFGLY